MISISLFYNAVEGLKQRRRSSLERLPQHYVRKKMK